MKHFCYLLLFLTACARQATAASTSAEAAKAETPAEAAATIGGLLKSGDYETLLTTRYSEWYKVEKEGADPKEAIKKFSGAFEAHKGMLMDIFSQLESAQFTMGTSVRAQETETGETATATVTIDGIDISYTLYKMKNGLWGFHL